MGTLRKKCSLNSCFWVCNSIQTRGAAVGKREVKIANKQCQGFPKTQLRERISVLWFSVVVQPCCIHKKIIPSFLDLECTERRGGSNPPRSKLEKGNASWGTSRWFSVPGKLVFFSQSVLPHVCVIILYFCHFLQREINKSLSIDWRKQLGMYVY